MIIDQLNLILLKKKGYFVNLHYKALHLNPLYKQFGFKKGDFPVADYHAKNTISFPCDQHLSKKQLKIIINTVKKFYHNES